jgi:hypothetical protein
MGEALVGAMVAAMRRANRDRADAARTAEPQAARSEGSAWGYLAHPALMPTVYSPGGESQEDAPVEGMAARKV